MAEDDAAATGSTASMRSMATLTKDLTRSSDAFGKAIVNAFSKGIVEGKRFEDVLKGVGKSMTESLLKSALKPLQSSLSGLLTTGVKSLTGLFTGGGLSGAAASVPVAPFADGGIVASPAYFPTGRGLGLMGERGAEAIMPLSRGPDGKLGVRAGGEAKRPLNVTVQVATQDADSFRRSEAQVSAAIARAVARGSRAL